MKKIFIAVLALCASLANAQKLENSLLWKISGNGLKQDSYLFGTIHITCDATLDKNTLNALDKTQQLYLELDMDDPNMQAIMMGGMMMKDGKTMSSMVSVEDFKTVDDFLTREMGMSAQMLNTVKPTMISTMLYTKMMDCPMQSFEMELMRVTQEQKEEIYGLEKVEDQMAIFDAIPYETQMEALVKTAKDNMKSDKDEFNKMMAVYKTKDITAMLNFMDESENKMYSDFRDVMLDNRNRNWIAVIEKVANDKPTFFGVGAAHLAGESGVIKLLRKKGYKVEAVK